MGGYAARRLGALALILIGASILTFLLTWATRGDPAEIILSERLGGERPSPEAVARMRHDLGLDRPVHVRYLIWTGRCLSGDFGLSYRTGEAIAPELVRRLARTVPLAILAMVFSLTFAVPAGMWAARRRGGGFDRASLAVTCLVLSTPAFLIGIALILLFAVLLQVFPAVGSDRVQHFVLPAATLALGVGAYTTRFTRACLLETLAEDYIRTARAKGLPESDVVGRHALRNALLPLLTLVALQLRDLVGGVVIVETVFGFRGIGLYLVDGILLRDYPVVQASVLVLVVATVAITLATDLSYALVDPRVRLGERG